MQNSVSKKVEIVVFLGLSLLEEATPYWNLHRICLLEFADVNRNQLVQPCFMPNIPVVR